MVTAARIFTPRELAAMARWRVEYTAREYTRRLTLREARRAEVHQLLGFTDAPYQPKRHGHNPGRQAQGNPVGRGTRKPGITKGKTPRNADRGLNTGAPWRFG